MIKYKRKIIIGIVGLIMTGSSIQLIEEMTVFSIIFGIFGVILGLIVIYCGFKRFKAIAFHDDNIVYYHPNNVDPPINILSKEIIGVSIIGNKIYIQTTSQNITIAKKSYTGDDYDIILNEIMKIQKKYNIKQ